MTKPGMPDKCQECEKKMVHVRRFNNGDNTYTFFYECEDREQCGHRTQTTDNEPEAAGCTYDRIDGPNAYPKKNLPLPPSIK